MSLREFARNPLTNQPRFHGRTGVQRLNSTRFPVIFPVHGNWRRHRSCRGVSHGRGWMVRSGRGIRFLTVSGHRMPSSKGLTYSRLSQHGLSRPVSANRRQTAHRGWSESWADTETVAMASRAHLKGDGFLTRRCIGQRIGARVAGPDRGALRRRQIQTPGERLASLSAEADGRKHTGPHPPSRRPPDRGVGSRVGCRPQPAGAGPQAAAATAPAAPARQPQDRNIDGSGFADGGNLYLDYKDPPSKNWVFRYKRNGRARDFGLGPFPLISLAEARELAVDCQRKLRTGIDPVDERRAARLAQKLEAPRR